MFKTITLLKRRPGLSMPEFIAYYETHHRRIGEKYLRGAAIRYVRRFLHPFPDPQTGKTDATDYDVVLEIWFPDRAAFDATMAALTAPEAAREIAADEARLFDRGKIRSFAVEEHESDLSVSPQE